VLSTEKPKIIPHPVARIALPVVFGVMIEVACDLLRCVVRYFSTSIYFEETRSVGAAKRLGPVDRIRIRRRAGRSIDMGPGCMAVGRSSSLGSYRPALNLGNLGRSPRSIWPHLPGETVGSVWKSSNRRGDACSSGSFRIWKSFGAAPHRQR
jgi:hypothetical protein